MRRAVNTGRAAGREAFDVVYLGLEKQRTVLADFKVSPPVSLVLPRKTERKNFAKLSLILAGIRVNYRTSSSRLFVGFDTKNSNAYTKQPEFCKETDCVFRRRGDMPVPEEHSSFRVKTSRYLLFIESCCKRKWMPADCIRMLRRPVFYVINSKRNTSLRYP